VAWPEEAVEEVEEEEEQALREIAMLSVATMVTSWHRGDLIRLTSRS
jgi:hypothetical protein